MSGSAMSVEVIEDYRVAEAPIDPHFLLRWSPRAFSDRALKVDQLQILLEAARWSPSSFNAQPWRFIYTLRESPDWETFVSLLMSFNQTWARHAAALMFVVSDTLMPAAPGEQAAPSYSHSFDAGAAWMALALQASKLGLQAHAMTGFHVDQARTTLGIPARFRIEAAIAIGAPGDPASLPEKLRAREKRSFRKSVTEFAYSGHWPK
jgi:nitroreductase